MNALCKIILVLSISLISGGIDNTCYGMDFRSDQLKEISKYISVEWPDRDSTFIAKCGGRDIVCRTSDNCIEHIGFRIFPEQLRTGVIAPSIADFVERYWLSLTLPVARQKSIKQQLSEDRFLFQTGSVESIDIIQQDTDISFSYQATPTLVTLSWDKDGKTICGITFPVDHELILGRRMIENDRRLPEEINSIRFKERPLRNPETGSVLNTDSLSSLIVENTGSYIDEALKSERYYVRSSDGMSLEPVFNDEWCRESIINLFTDYDIEKARDIRLLIRHKTFGINEQTIETTIPRFIAYSMQNGCVPYVGIVSIDEGPSQLADVLVIMHNSQVGYNHVLRVSVPLESISTGKGTSHARLNAFVPSSNIKNLFKD